MRRRSYFTLALGLLGSVSTAVCACDTSEDASGDDASASDSGAGTDTSTPTKADGSATTDGGTNDATADLDARPDVVDPIDAQTDADAGPSVTSTLGSTGFVRILDGLVRASFYEDDTTLRVSDSADCVARVRSSTKPRSGAGVLSIGGPFVGSDGGAPNPIDIFPDIDNSYSFDGPIFAEENLSMLVGMDSTDTFPTLTTQTLRTVPAGIVTLSKPAKPDSGALTVSAAQDLEVVWSPPADTTNLRLSVDMTSIQATASASKAAAIYCSFALSSGSAHVPASLIAAVRERLGGESTGYIAATVTSGVELTPLTASYLVRVSRVQPTTSHPETALIEAKIP